VLTVFREITQELEEIIKDDPVRPEIPICERVNSNSEIFMLKDTVTGQAQAVVCVKFLNKIPESVTELVTVNQQFTTAVFYTIWSYAQGAGRDLIAQARAEIAEAHPEIDTYVTLSPKTEMARKFHHKNGATTYRENADSVNYLYR
jgi:hypothetical protein